MNLEIDHRTEAYVAAVRRMQTAIETVERIAEEVRNGHQQIDRWIKDPKRNSDELSLMSLENPFEVGFGIDQGAWPSFDVIDKAMRGYSEARKHLFRIHHLVPPEVTVALKKPEDFKLTSHDRTIQGR